MRAIVKRRILLKCGHKCVYCGSREKLEVDHIIPLHCGGEHSEFNFQILCRTCNRKKGRGDREEAIQQYIINDPDKDHILVNPELIKRGFDPKFLATVIMMALENPGKVGRHG